MLEGVKAHVPGIKVESKAVKLDHRLMQSMCESFLLVIHHTFMGVKVYLFSLV